MYHRVVPPQDARDSSPSLVVPPDVFAAQMTALDRAGWRTITLARLADDLAGGRRPAPRTFVITFDDGYDDGFLYALPILQQHGFVATYFIVTGRLSRPGDLTADHVRALVSAGMEIGDHTVDHLGLAGLPLAKMRFEVETSALAIEALTGARPTTFAYPFGSDDPAVAAEVARAGFALAVTSVEGVGESAWNRYTVPRLRVGPSMPAAALVNMVSRYP
jgi:peptidoglycan/xylan/chitin deacetylase (PgdA/CDA1 family)